MGLEKFKKFFIVEEGGENLIQEGVNLELVGLQRSIETQTPDIEIESSAISIDELYEKLQLSNKEMSVFRIEEFLNALPNELPEEVKRTTVASLLKTAKIDLNVLIDDGDMRAIKLLSLFGKMKDAALAEKEANAERITELLNEIEELKSTNLEISKMLEEQTKLVTDEVEKIRKIQNFIGRKPEGVM